MNDTFLVSVARNNTPQGNPQDRITIVTPSGAVETATVCNGRVTVEATIMARLSAAYPVRKWHGYRLVYSGLIDEADLPSPKAGLFVFEVDCDSMPPLMGSRKASLKVVSDSE